MSQVFINSFKILLSGLRFRRNRDDEKLERDKLLVARSNLFDPQWYLQRYADVARAELDPLQHFVLHGGVEGRSPSPRFDARWYLQRNTDVARSGVNPLIHYLEHGRHEGRSIKPLRPGRDNAAEPAQSEQSRLPSVEVAAEPYANEFDAIWRAEPIKWRSLGKDAARSSDFAADSPIDLDSLLAGLDNGPDRDRIGLFSGLARLEKTIRNTDWQHIDCTGLGLDVLTDGWFAHSRQLLLRASSDIRGANQVIGFQCGTDGSLHQIAARDWAGATCLLRLNLENPLGPVLLVWLASDGTVVHTALPVFPSLYRGGLHHAEALAFGALHPDPSGIADYMTDLAKELFGNEHLLLGSILVDLRGANGSEPIFQTAIVTGLGYHFGVKLAAQDDQNRSTLLADRLETASNHPAMAARRGCGAELRLPADCLPSLASLCSSARNNRIGASSFCILPENDQASAVMACLPWPANVGRAPSHPALPPAQPTWRAGPNGVFPGVQAGLPSAIRLMNARVWQIDPLLPQSPDIALSGETDGNRAHPTVRIILSHRGTQSELDLCLRAIAAQTAVHIVKVQLHTDQTNITKIVSGGLPVEVHTLTDGGLAASNPGTRSEEIIILLDSSVLPHDPRTFATLVTLCRADGCGAATCPAVTCCPDDGVEERATLPWIPDCTQTPFESAGQLIVKLFPATTFAVCAGDPRILAIRSDTWSDFRIDESVVEQPADLALALARHCSQNGLRTLATTLVRVATNQSEPAMPEPSRFSDLVEAGFTHECHTHLIRLMP